MIEKQSSFPLLFLFVILISFTSCIINENIEDTSIKVDPGNDPNFEIIANYEKNFEVFNRKVIVFDIPLYAFEAVEDSKLLHAANILAQYLDNNEDGTVDNTTVHNAMKSNKAFVFLWKTSTERDAFNQPAGYIGQSIGADTVIPVWHTNGHVGDFDNSLKTLWHSITNTGYQKAYPNVFGPLATSEIGIAMNVARGGNFPNPPANYPASAWFTNTTPSCNYTCQVNEYLYWIMSSILGAQENRITDIGNEWSLNTSIKVQTDDVKAWTIFSNTTYSLPSILPDGGYKQ